MCSITTLLCLAVAQPTFSPPPPPRRKRAPAPSCSSHWRLQAVDQREAVDITTNYGTVKLYNATDPREFEAFAELCARQIGPKYKSQYAGATKNIDGLKQRMKPHLRKFNDLGARNHTSLVMVAVKVHNMGNYVADGKQYSKDKGIEEYWNQCNISARPGAQPINRHPCGSGSFPDDDETIIVYMVFAEDEASTETPRCLMRQEVIKGTYGTPGAARDPWEYKELVIVERCGSAPRTHARGSQSVWSACVAELKEQDFKRTEGACNQLYSRLAAQDESLPVFIFGAEEWLDEEKAAYRAHVQRSGSSRWAVCAESVSAVGGSPGRTEEACKGFYYDNVFVEGVAGAPGQYKPTSRASAPIKKARAALKRLGKAFAKKVEASLVAHLGDAIPRAWIRRVCLADFKAALEHNPPLPEDQIRSALLGLTKTDIDAAEAVVRAEMADEFATAQAALAAATTSSARKPAARKPARTPAVHAPTDPAPAARAVPTNVRPAADIMEWLPPFNLTRAFADGKLFAVTGVMGEAHGENVSQSRLRKVLVHRLGATVDVTQYMTKDVDYLIVGGTNASGAKIQRADCSPTTTILRSADVLALLEPDDTKMAVQLWRKSQAELEYFKPDNLEFLHGINVYVTGGLGLPGFTKDERLMRVFEHYGAKLILEPDQRLVSEVVRARRPEHGGRRHQRARRRAGQRDPRHLRGGPPRPRLRPAAVQAGEGLRAGLTPPGRPLLPPSPKCTPSRREGPLQGGD